MSTAPDFFVRGTPAPGGSKDVHFPRDARGRFYIRNGWPVYHIVDSGKGNKEWRRDVARAATIAMNGAQPFRGPLRMVVEFLMPRPKSHHQGNDRERPLTARAPAMHIQAPDASKLLRSTEDAMTGIVYADDAQIVQHATSKRWAEPGEQAGARIKITMPLDF